LQTISLDIILKNTVQVGNPVMGIGRIKIQTEVFAFSATESRGTWKFRDHPNAALYIYEDEKDPAAGTEPQSELSVMDIHQIDQMRDNQTLVQILETAIDHPGLSMGGKF
jgi:hypothetical protein